MSGTALEGLITEETQAPLETVAPAPSPEPTPSPAPEPVAAVTPAPVMEAPVQPVATQQPNGQLVPLAVVLDERDRRKAVEAEAAQLRAWRADEERKRREAVEQAPNMLDDPDGYHLWREERAEKRLQKVTSQFEQTLVQTNLRWSETIARRHLGPEKFNELNQWIATRWDAQTHEHAKRQPDPYGWAQEQFEREQRALRVRTLEERLGDKDLDAFLEEQKHKWLAENAPQSPSPIQDNPPHPATAQPRAPDGKFASPSEPQRFEPVSLTAVPAASNSRNGNNKTGLTLTGLIDS